MGHIVLQTYTEKVGLIDLKEGEKKGRRIKKKNEKNEKKNKKEKK